MTPEELKKVEKTLVNSTDPQELYKTLGGNDNVLCLVYGPRIQTFRNLWTLFLGSPVQSGLHNTWKYSGPKERIPFVTEYLEKDQIVEDTLEFDHVPRTATASVHLTNSNQTFAINPQFERDGNKPDVYLSFHPTTFRKKDTPQIVGLARGVSDFLQYAIRNLEIDFLGGDPSNWEHR